VSVINKKVGVIGRCLRGFRGWKVKKLKVPNARGDMDSTNQHEIQKTQGGERKGNSKKQKVNQSFPSRSEGFTQKFCSPKATFLNLQPRGGGEEKAQQIIKIRSSKGGGRYGGETG